MSVSNTVPISRSEAPWSNFFTKTVPTSGSKYQCPIDITASNNTTSRSALNFSLDAGKDTETKDGNGRSLLSNAMVYRSEFLLIVGLRLPRGAKTNMIEFWQFCKDSDDYDVEAFIKFIELRCKL